MKTLRYYLTFVNSRSGSRIRQIRTRTSFSILLLCGFLAGTIGFVRCAWFAASYSFAKIGFYHEYCEKQQLVVKIDFLDKILIKETATLNSLVVFEDVTRLAYGMNPISADVRKAGIGGTPSLETRIEEANKNSLIKRAVVVHESLSTLFREAQLQNTTFEQMCNQLDQVHKYWAQYPSIRPATGSVTSGYGYRPDPISGNTLFHDGLDIANAMGTPVFAPADGIVREAGVLQQYGNAVIIGHPESGVETVFGHLSKYLVLSHQAVKRGDLIGFIGNSGKSTGPHLHYEVRKQGQAVNPVSFILPPDQVVD